MTNIIEFYCTCCKFRQIEDVTGPSIQITCPNCGNRHFTTEEPETNYVPSGGDLE